MSDHIGSFVIVRSGKVVTATGGLEPGGDVALLRSVAVHPARRNQGLGAAIVKELLGRAESAGARELWLLTTDAADWWTRFGFMPSSREEIPAALRGSAEMDACPATATVMVRR